MAVVVASASRGLFSLALDIDGTSSQEVSVTLEFDRHMFRKDRKAFNVRGVDGPGGVPAVPVTRLTQRPADCGVMFPAVRLRRGH